MAVSRTVPQSADPSRLFDGRVALIVGGSGGIGRAVADALAATGARLRLHGRNAQRLAAVAHQAHGSFPVETVVCDLGSGGHTSQNLEHSIGVMLEAGVPDILVVSYGPFLEASLLETDAEQWRALFEANVMLPVLLAQRCIPVMLQRGFGRVLVFGGTGTDRIAGFRTVAAYSAVKTALMSWVKSAARDVASATQQGGRPNVAVNAICPGYVATEYLSPRTRERYARRIPGGRLSTPEEVASAALALLDPGSTILNGAILPIDGGTRG